MAFKYRIYHHEIEIQKGNNILRKVSGEALDSQYGSLFKFNVSHDGILKIKGTRSMIYRKNGELAYKPLKLGAEDGDVISSVVSHWQQIRHSFVRQIDHGGAMIGYIGTTYLFPDGTTKEWLKESFRKGLPNELQEPLPQVKGPSIDDKFPSHGCDYIENFPARQHYSTGRFDFFLEQDRMAIEDANTIQEIHHRPEAIIELLTLIAKNPHDTLSRLLKEEH